MTRGRKIVLAAGLGCLLLIGLVLASQHSPGGSTGGASGLQPGVVNVTGHPAAARFTLAPLTGHGPRISLGQYGGRPVLINFFASDCAICRSETPLLARFYRAHHGRVAVIGVDVADAPSAALSLVRGAGAGYPVGTDPTASAASGYGVSALPQTFFLNGGHRIIQRVIGALTEADLNSGLGRIQ